jgi:hypothetical protein
VQTTAETVVVVAQVVAEPMAVQVEAVDQGTTVVPVVDPVQTLCPRVVQKITDQA